MAELKIGQTVRYVRIGTVGKIVAFSEQDGMTFAELDTSGLLYRIDQLVEIAETTHVKKQKRNVRKEAADEQERLKAINESAWLTVDNSCEGGG